MTSFSFYFSTFLFLTFISFLLSNSIRCPGSKSGSCKCQTTEGIYCPSGYYCPSYTSQTIQDNNLTIIQANCIVRNDGQLQCPCSPGFYCPENTLSPSYCCAGYYCPTPMIMKQCKRGYFCKTGYVEGIKCGSDTDCPEGSEDYSNSPALGTILATAIVLYAMFLIKYYLEAKVRESKSNAIILMKAGEPVVAEEVSRNRSVTNCQPISEPQTYPEENNTTNPKHVTPMKLSRDSNEEIDLEQCVQKSGNEYTIEFNDISLILPNGVQIMKGVTGKFLPRRLCAIMGPSGAGKTTIISLVTGKAIKTGGTIKVNGQIVNDLSKWKKLVGFVPQEDVMIRQLRVRDNIEFSANFRLPAEMTYKERMNVVNETLIDLGIEHVQFSVIGDERERGISGGQRKRVNIALELVALPKVLFLDEPTSGLDSTSSVILARQLKDIALRRGVTIASVIHQPSIQAFLEFDDLLLLGKGGQVVYHGPISDASAYFESIGFTPTGLTNPADFYLDIANGAVPRAGDPNFTPPHLFKFWNNKIHGRPLDYDENQNQNTVGLSPIESTEALQTINDEVNPSNLEALLVFFRAIFRFFYQMIEDFFIAMYESALTFINEITRNDEIRNTPGFLGQLFYCIKRSFKQKYARYSQFLSQMLIHLGVALVVASAATDLEYVGPLPDVICATVTRDLYRQCTAPLSDSYQGTGNFLIFGMIFAAMSISTGTFGNEQVNYWRESAAGLKTAPYFIAKWIMEIPNIVLAALFFWLAFQIRFPSTDTSGDLYTLFFAMYWWCWSLGFLLSSIASPKNVFLLGVVSALILAVGFSGANPTINEIKDLPAGIRWVWRISGTRWALEAFYVSQVKYYQKVPDGPLKDEPYMNVDAGLDLIGYNIDYFNYCIRALMWNGFGYAIFAMIIMKFSNRDKKK